MGFFVIIIMKDRRNFDYWVILMIIGAAIPIILQFKVRPLTSAFFFFVLPTLYLFFKRPKPIKRIWAGTLLLGVGLGFTFNVILSANKAWDELSSQLVFNYRIFGFWPMDEPIWFILWVLFILTFYEHFYDREKSDYVSGRFKYVIVPTFLILFIVLTLFAIKQDILRLPYAYFILALPSIIPVVYVAKIDPYLLVKFVKAGGFFFILYLIYEITALKLGQWYFPGEYIGFVKLAGVQFPFEELLFWIILSSTAILSLYEGFVDNEK